MPGQILDGLLGVLNRCSGPTVTSVTPRITHVEQLPWRPGRQDGILAALGDPGDPATASRPRASSVPGRHQAQAADSRTGRDVVIATRTASGKSLAYQLPALTSFLANPRACVLYLAPTKALAADQLAL